MGICDICDMSDLLWPRRKYYNETNTFQNGIERGKKTLVEMKINSTTSGGGNKEILIIMGDKENSVENFEKEYLGFRR